MARTPLYQTIEAEMISRISSGAWAVGLRLPNEFGLADEFNVSQGTMRRALISLEEKGFLSRKPGRGTIVAAQAPTVADAPALTPVVMDEDGTPLVLEPFRARGGTRAATQAEADTMDTQRVAYLERTLKHNGRRAALETVALPEGLVAELDEDAPSALGAFLEHHGLSAARLTADARAEVTDMSQAVALSVDRHTPMLVIRTAAHDAAGHVIARQIQRIATEGARLVHQ